MAFNHEDAAVQGLSPKFFNHFSVAIQGLLTFEVIIEPVEDDSRAGGLAPDRLRPKKDKYTVTIRVTRKGKVWHYSTVVGNLFAKVVARFLGQKLVEPDIEVTSVSVMKKADPTVKVEKK